MSICNGCNKEKKIVNKHFELCLFCNKERLRPVKKEELDNSYFTKKNKEKKVNKIKEDEDFYKECFDSCLEHKCEECGSPLPDKFKDDNGKVIAKWRYSHIIPKSIHSKLRHVVKNINHLCFDCHQEWENGNKESMSIFEKNKKRFPWYFSQKL